MDWTQAELAQRVGYSVATIRKLLLKHADDKKPFKGKVASGGRLNIRRSLEAID